MVDERTKTRPRSRQYLYLSGIILLIAAVIIGSYLYMHRPRTLSATDLSDIKSTTGTAFGAVDELLVIPGASSNLSQKIAPAAIAAARNHAASVLHAIYDPKCVVCSNIEISIDRTLAGQAGSVYRALDGGARDLNWSDPVIADTGIVQITVQGTIWSSLLTNTGQVHPSEHVVTTYTLQKVASHWIITNQSVQGKNGP